VGGLVIAQERGRESVSARFSDQAFKQGFLAAIEPLMAATS
jgi:hypothetical protein